VNRLKKFIERRADGERSGRIAYAFDGSSLPQPAEGMDWRVAPSFSAANELLNDASLAEVFKAAIDRGYAVVTRSG
jgi:hypothetical protein